MTNNQDKEQIISDMQDVIYQMKLDDIEENPDSEFELFTCSACANDAPLAGSIQYSKYRLCNDCVLMYETALKLNKIKNIEEFMAHTEDNRLKTMCEFIKKDTQKENN
ncbi:hypothetical protein IJ531_06285 [bacterium]|nr:hypothetical protein [bacterium]